MTTYLTRRLLQTVFVILGVTLLTFVALHLAGDPTYLYVSERATAEEVAAARAKLGFDKPLPRAVPRLHERAGCALTWATRCARARRPLASSWSACPPRSS